MNQSEKDIPEKDGKITTASAAALMPALTCPRPLPRATISALCGTLNPTISRVTNKNVDTSLGEAPSIAERLRWGGSHGTALYFLLTVSTFPRHRCGGRCSSCRGQRMLLSLRDCRSAHHQNILSCAGMLSCTFPEIQHCSLHKPSKENPIVTLRQFFQFLHKGIRITRAGRCQVLDKFFTNKFEKKQKNKPYKAFSRYRTDLSLVGLNSLLYMFFLRPPAERCWAG